MRALESKSVAKAGPATAHPRRLALAGALLVLVACSSVEPFDSAAHLRRELADRIGAEEAVRIELPFELDDEVRAAALAHISPSGGERRRVESVLEFVFDWLDLQYAPSPTRNAIETFRDREGNCLSFVNLFVGVARLNRLNPFYVEVQDLQRWAYQQGTVLSRGHIVAGLRIEGELSTFDFLPYRPKAYRDFRPIDDLTAAAHHYNNLGAEALLAGDLERAKEMLDIALELAPSFEKAINNLGLYLMRKGELEEAARVLEAGLGAHPESVPLLNNLARAYQTLGRNEAASALLERIEGTRNVNPYYLIYRGELALARGDTATALEYMQRAFREETELPEVHVGLVKVYLALGDLEKARHHVARALTLDATHEEARRYAELLQGGQLESQP